MEVIMYILHNYGSVIDEWYEDNKYYKLKADAIEDCDSKPFPSIVIDAVRQNTIHENNYRVPKQ